MQDQGGKSNALSRILWFVGLWIAGVSCVSLLAFIIRSMIL